MNLRVPAVRESGARRLTGRTVLFLLLGFFGFVGIVNVVMVKAAISTFGGVDTPSSYQAGIDFKSERAAADAQRALGWMVDGEVSAADSGSRALTVTVKDKTGEPVSGIDVVARFAHPVDTRRDVVLAMHPVGHGVFTGGGPVPAGRWRLDIDILRDDERMFRSQNRIVTR
jgi:nitrogen fixation protein FixH